MNIMNSMARNGLVLQDHEHIIYARMMFNIVAERERPNLGFFRDVRAA